jgi:Na+/phosphate symporter
MNQAPVRVLDPRSSPSRVAREIVEEMRAIRDELCTFTVRGMRTDLSASEERRLAELVGIAKRIVDLADDVEAMERAR